MSEKKYSLWKLLNIINSMEKSSPKYMKEQIQHMTINMVEMETFDMNVEKEKKNDIKDG